MLNRRNFLGTLIQREHGEANAVSPRLPSRYEPIERSGAVAAFEETEPAPANREANALDARQPDSRQHSPERPDTDPLDAESIQSQLNDTSEAPDKGMLVEHVGKTRPAASVATQRETADLVPGRGFTADIGPAADAVKSVAAEPGREVKSGGPSNPRTEEPDPRTEEPDRIGSGLKHRGDEQRHTIPAAPVPPIAVPAEEPGQNLQRQVMASPVPGTAPASSLEPNLSGRESALRTGRPPLSPDTDREETAVTKLGKAKRAELISPDNSFIPDAAGEPVPENSARNNNYPLDAPRAGDSVSQEERNSRIAPAPRVEASARVRVTKTGDIAPLPPHVQGSEPPRRQPNVPPPPEPTINVTIGRIEVRAVTASAAPRRNNAGPKPMSLREYLSRHSGNNRRGTQ